MAIPLVINSGFTGPEWIEKALNTVNPLALRARAQVRQRVRRNQRF
ncbi:hypothetical protein ACFL3A_08255 [Pseudomonadota bacterium]